MKKYNHLLFSLLLLALSGTMVDLLYNALLANILPTRLYGDFIVAYSVLGIVAVVMLLGTDVGCFSYIPVFMKEKKRTNLLAYISWSLRLIVITSACFLFCFLCLLAVGYGLYNFNILHEFDLHVMIAVVVIAPVYVLEMLLISYLYVGNQSKVAYILDHVLPYVFIGLVLYLVIVVFELPVTDFMFSIVLFISLLVLALLTIIIFIKRSRPKLSHAVLDSIAHPVKKENHWLSHSLRLMSGVFLYQLVMSLDIFLIEGFSHQEISVGYYAATLAICFFITASSSTCFKPLLPLISAGFASGELDELKKKLVVSNRVNSIYCLLSSLIIYCFLPEITAFFFDASFVEPCVTTGRILLVSMFLSSLLWPATILLRHTQNERKVIQCRFMELVLLVGVGIPFIRWYGIAGMAATQVLVQGVSGSVKCFFVRRILKIKPLSLI